MGFTGATVMYEEGRSMPRKCCGKYREVLPGATKEQMFEILRDEIRATGCGIMDFSKTKDEFEVIILDPPISKETDYT